jgi:hypothetical protein
MVKSIHAWVPIGNIVGQSSLDGVRYTLKKLCEVDRPLGVTYPFKADLDLEGNVLKLNKGPLRQ